MENETNALVPEDAIPTEQEEANEVAENTDNVPQVSDIEAGEGAEQAEGEGENGAEVNTEAAEEPIITVRYNKQDRGLTRAEAKDLAEKGLKYDSMNEMLNDIKYLAAIQDKTPAELIKSYIEAGENIKRQELVDRYGEDNEVIEVLMEKFRTENQQKFSAVKETIKQKEEAAERDLNMRLAEEFQNMKADFTELTDYASLPLDVKRAAVNGTPLNMRIWNISTHRRSWLRRLKVKPSRRPRNPRAVWYRLKEKTLQPMHCSADYGELNIKN